MKEKYRTVFVAVVVATLISVIASAEAPPDRLMQQGRIVMNGTALEGDHSLTFRVYDGTGTILHEETKIVGFHGGYYSQLIGVGASGFLSYFTGGDARSVGITVDGGSELTPRQDIVSVPYAISSFSVQGGPVEASDIAIASAGGAIPVVDATGNWVGVGDTIPCAGCVVTTDVATGGITSGNILNGTIVSADVADGTLTGADVQDGTIQDVDITGGVILEANVTTVMTTYNLFTSNPVLSPFCPIGYTLLGGGIEISPASDISSGKTRIVAAYPSMDGAYFYCSAVTTDVSTTGRQMRCYARCGRNQ